jgi:hypothetical protein
MRTVQQRIIVVSAVFFVSMNSMRAQDACTALLQHGIYDTYSAQSSSQSFSSFRSNFCGWYSTYRQQNISAQAGASIPIVDIPIGLQASMTYGEADAMSQALCSSVASTSSSDQAWSVINKTLDPTGALAFSQCVTALQHGLEVDFRINDDDSIAVIGLAYNPPLGATNATLNSITTDGWTCNSPPSPGTDLHSILGRTGKLTNSQVGLSCTRNVQSTPFVVGGQKVVADKAVLSFQTSAGMFAAFFRPMLYQDPIADTAKVLASYPKGTILPFAGPSSTIPNGWHICDGTNGTVNLENRLPYGASGDAQLGELAGSPSHTHTFSGTTSKPAGVDNTHVVQDGHSSLTVKGTDHTHTYSGTTSEANNLPPVTFIYFIQKIT